MASSKKIVKLITIGLIVHILLLIAVFDIYFASPIEHGMPPVKTNSTPLAKRAVLIVADGLRADSLYDEIQKYPYLNNIKENRSSWGISHARVPTESRPGHVALLAGIYEDPSAILKGWQVNPVTFDSIVNQSTNAWCWGSPDIINLFNQESRPHIRQFTYDPKYQDFGKEDSTILDLWVFDEVQTFFDKHFNDTNLDQNGNLFFLHLLGADTAGHGFKPQSKEYNQTIHVIDSHLTNIEKIFENRFNDDSTTYIFTSDHGMTDWGSHGAGLDAEILTPIIVWGSGIKRENIQKNISQIDVAPMISAIIGNNIPSNSLGKLPYNYFDTTHENLQKMLDTNLKQLLELVKIKQRPIEENAYYYVPYKNLKFVDLVEKIGHFRHSFAKNEVELMLKIYDKLADTLIEAFHYYHNYYQKEILCATVTGFILWMIYLMIFILHDFNGCEMNPVKIKYWLLLTIICVNLLLFYCKLSSLTYFIYINFPLVMFYITFDDLIILKNKLVEIIFNSKNSSLLKTSLKILIGLEFLFLGFYKKMLISIAMCFVLKWNQTIKNPYYFIYWMIFGISLSIFPLLPDMMTDFFAPTFLFGIGFYCYVSNMIPNLFKYDHQPQNRIVRYQISLFCATGSYTILVHFGFVSSNSPLKNISWLFFILPILLIMFSNKTVLRRIYCIFFGLAPFYLMVTMNHELIFLTLYFLFLRTWLEIECQDTPGTLRMHNFDFVTKNRRNLIEKDIRLGYYYMVFIFLGFFGTGNIASLNSFDPMWVRCFLTVFSPFKMAGLILFKTMVPFILTTCIFRAIHKLDGGSLIRRFCIILLYSDFLLLHFLFMIKNVGSWLEIGMSLSHFIIMEMFIVIILFMYVIATVLTSMVSPFKSS